MPDRAELESLSSQELHDQATRVAWRRLDVALLNDLVDADRDELADALRPLYVDDLVEHGDAVDREGDDG